MLTKDPNEYVQERREERERKEKKRKRERKKKTPPVPIKHVKIQEVKCKG